MSTATTPVIPFDSSSTTAAQCLLNLVDLPATIHVGEFLACNFGYDTQIVEVVDVTASTVTVRKTQDGGVTYQRNECNGEHDVPVRYRVMVADVDGPSKTIELRDGKLHTKGWRQWLYRPMHINGQPVKRVEV